MKMRRFATLDVFAAEPLLGNPLAVVRDADDLDAARMQAIAREFNLSETTFILPPADARHRARVRIFTPTNELPFAGHPTIGTAALLALIDGHEAAAFGLELAVGSVACVVERRGKRGARARFRAPKLPQALQSSVSREAAAAALGLEPRDVGSHRHVISRYTAGVPYDFVPVADLAALAAAKPNGALFEKTFVGEHAAAYVYARTGQGFRARMFAPALGVPEDPATGSAAAAFAGVLMQFEALGDGVHDVEIVQGMEMGRESRIGLQLMIEQGALVGVELAGEAVVISEGTLHV
jgi:trans-2,3-dihydro-3-hydroxyanthranilate isomerase